MDNGHDLVRPWWPGRHFSSYSVEHVFTLRKMDIVHKEVYRNAVNGLISLAITRYMYIAKWMLAGFLCSVQKCGVHIHTDTLVCVYVCACVCLCACVRVRACAWACAVSKAYEQIYSTAQAFPARQSSSCQKGWIKHHCCLCVIFYKLASF